MESPSILCMLVHNTVIAQMILSASTTLMTWSFKPIEMPDQHEIPDQHIFG
jgi:hypothetical protein